MSDRYVAEVVQVDGVRTIRVTWQGFLKGDFPSIEAMEAAGISVEDVHLRLPEDCDR